MSLGREIKEAIGAFGAINRIDTERRRTNAYEEMARNKGSNGAPSGSVIDENYRKKHGALPPGVTPLGKPPGMLARIGNAIGIGGGTSGGGRSDGTIYQMPLDPNTGTLDEPPRYAAETSETEDNVPGYQEGGVVDRMRALGADHSPMPQYSVPVEPIEAPPADVQTVAPGAPPVAPPAPAVTTPVEPIERFDVRDPNVVPYEGVPTFGDTPASVARGAVPARSEAAPAVVPAGNSTGGTKGKRKALRDQTRTEAYDPVLDKDDPDNMIRMAINGAMEYANDTFHLKGTKIDAIGTEDPHSAGGRMAFLNGTGAAPEELVQGINKIAAETAPDKKLLAADPNVRDSIVALRRLNLVYEHFVQTGQTEKANKAAFEIIQYSAVKSSEFGTQAKAALAAGDIEGAKRLVARAYSQVPDGNHMVISPDGKTAIIRGDDGKPVDQYTITPQNLLQAALGLSNKSLFWDILNQRANSVGKNKAKEPTELDKARIENLKARTEAVKAKMGGKGGPAAPAPVSPVAGILSELQRATGTAPPNPNPGGEGSQPASPAQVSEAPTADGDPDPDVQTAAVSPAMQGTDEVQEGGGDGPQLPPASPMRLNRPTARQAGSTPGDTPATTPAAAPTSSGPPPDSVLRVNKSAPASAPQPVTPAGKPAAPAKFDPDGKDYDYESAKAAGLKPDETGHWPSRDPNSGLLFKGRGHETWAKTIEGENKAGYQVFKGKDGRYYSIMDNEAVPDELVHDGKRTSAPVFKPPKYEETHPGAKLVGTKFEGSNPYSKVLQDEGFRKWVAANTKNKVGPQELARVQSMEREYNNQIKAWETGKKSFEKEHRDAFNREQALSAAEAKRVYDRSLTTRELQELPAEITVHAETLRGSKAKDGTVRPSVWNAPEEVAKPEELKELATNLFTSNRNMTPAMTARMIAELTTPGTEQKERQFMPVGRDRAGNIVVRLKNDDSVEVHIRPGAYTKINRITERYRDHLLKEKTKPAGRTWGDAVKPLGDALSKLPGKVEDGSFTMDLFRAQGAINQFPGRVLKGVDNWSEKVKAKQQAREPSGAVDAIRNRALQPNRYYNP